MDFSTLHPKIVHIPLALAIILPLLNLSLVLSWWKRWLPRQVWIISACLHALMTFTAFVAMQTGETDEHTVERVVSEHEIDEHEEAAELFLWVSVIALLLALVAAIADQEKLGLKYALATTVLAFLCAFFGFAARLSFEAFSISVLFISYRFAALSKIFFLYLGYAFFCCARCQSLFLA